VADGSVYKPANAPKFRTFKPFDDETLCALEDAHGAIAKVRGAAPPPRAWRANDEPEPPWEVVFRKPTLGEVEMYEGRAHQNEKARAAMVRDHAKATVVGVSLGGVQVVCMDRSDPKSVKEVRDAWDRLRANHGAAHLAAQDDLMLLMGSVKDEAGKD
jgi:hypothetical protein